MQEGSTKALSPPNQLKVPAGPTAAPTIRGSYSPGWSALGNKSFGNDLTPVRSDDGGSFREVEEEERQRLKEPPAKVLRCHCALL